MCETPVSTSVPRPIAINTKALAGIALLIAAVACFAILDMTTKRVTAEVSMHMALCIRSVFQAVATTAWVVPQRGISILKTANPGMQAVRGLLLLLVTLLAFASLKYLPVAEFTAIVMTTQFYTSWVGTLLSALPLYWVWIEIDNGCLWSGLLLMGIAGAVGHFLLIMAFERTPAAALMPYMYVQIGFALLGGWIMFGHIPDHLSLIGIGLIAACGIAGGLLTVHEDRVGN